MNIRYKLTLQFTLIVAAILLILIVGVYYFSASFRENNFYSRLTGRAYTTARLFLNVKEVDVNLLKIIDKNTLSLYQESVYIIDEQNRLIYYNSEHAFRGYQHLAKIREDKVYRFVDGRKEAIGLLYEYDSHQYCVVASAYDIFGIAKIKNLKFILVAGFMVTLVISMFAGLVFAGRALKPISTMVGQVRQISITNLNLRLDEGNKKDEIALLALTFNQMLQRLEESFVLQRDFVSNAAHELRTPFSVLLAEIEYTLLQGRDKEQYVETLRNLGAELKRLSNLSNGLLDLARMSFDNYSFNQETIRIDELLVDTCNDVLSVNRDYKLRIHLDNLPDNDTLLNITGSALLLKVALRNVIENACKFSVSKEADVYLLVAEGELTLSCVDHGIGIPGEELGNIFQPFFRGANTQFIGGFGLGLALSRKIVDLHGGRISVASREGEGSTFNLSFPVKGKF